MPELIEPFWIEPLATEPGWMDVSAAYCRLYHGLGGVENVDYDTPVAVAPLDSEPAPVALDLSPGQRHFLAARAVSAAGVEEQNTHVVCCVELNEAGELLPTPLGAVSELTAWPEPEGGVIVGFSYEPPLGGAAAEYFEVLSDGGAGALDLNTPIATVPALSPSDDPPGARQDYEAVVWPEVLPVLLAVRACAGGRNGPMGLPVTVPAPALLGLVVLP